MIRHLIRFALAFHVLAFVAGLLHMIAIRLFVTDFGDIEKFSERMEELRLVWIAVLLVTTVSAVYTWSLRKRPLPWEKVDDLHRSP
jgi:succinate dehydrogenase/fumarate reductase cytochrome b subunit